MSFTNHIITTTISSYSIFDELHHGCVYETILQSHHSHNLVKRNKYCRDISDEATFVGIKKIIKS